MPKWTNPQLNAINTRGKNILVSAAAGSGKTAVLVERVIKLITEDEVSVDKLLIVTFTNAAATEMKARISTRLKQLLKENSNDQNIMKQLSLLPNANISTIDSFCINLVRENFFELGIDQDFKILDDTEKNIIEQAAVDELIDELYEENSQDFLDLVEAFSSSKSDKNLAQVICKISNYITSQAFPDRWLDNACELYNPNVNIDESYISNYVFSECKDYVNFAADLIDECINSLTPDDELFDKYNEMLCADKMIYQKLNELIINRKWNEISNYSKNASFDRMPSKRNYESPSKSLIKKNRDLYKSIISKNIYNLFSVTKEEYNADCKNLYPLITRLVSIVKQFNEKTFEIKSDLNSYTFSDIEHLAIKLLYYVNDNEQICKTDLAIDLQSSFAEILVDEYQDTNSLQDTLFSMLSNGRNRFMVGDIKQSIYRFRLAMPEIFNGMKNNYNTFDDSDTNNQKIILSSNFRSRDGVCSYTNFVFSHFMSEHVGDVLYNEDEYLNASADYDKTDVPNAQLRVVDVPDEYNADEYEATQIANYIINKVNSNELIKDGDTYRPINYSDIAVLFRSIKTRLPVYEKVFLQYGIPVALDNRVNLFENSEIIILLNLLRVIDNPVQDIPLLATLMSVFYGYTVDDISRARVSCPRGNLYSAISKCDDFKSFIDDLGRYREYASSMSVENLVRHIVDITSYLSIISSMGNPEQKVLNVLKFVDIAKKFDNGENVGLTAFIRYIDTIVSSGYSIESASVNHSSDNSVRIMTIHASKGLEFPVCILADTAHQYNYDDLKGDILLNSRLGIGLKVHNSEFMYRYNSLQNLVIKDINTKEMMSENLRVLYVAITRAKEQFVAFYSYKNVARRLNKLSTNIVEGQVNPLAVKNLISDGDIIMMSALLHKDGEQLRNMCDDEIKIDIYYDFPLDIRFCDDEIEEASEKDTISSVDKELLNGIKERLSFNYPRYEISNFVSKRTASSLDEKEQNFKYLTSSKPAFLSQSNMTSAQKGTAMHSFMQFCDYQNAKDNLENEIARLVDCRYITVEQAQSLNRKQLSDLFNSEFARRMFDSENIYREIKVSSFVPVNELENTEFTDSVLVQGIADCVFEENGELVLVDYKTDKVNNEDELLERYKNQVAFYKNAVAKTLKKNVKQAVLYSFSLNKVCVYK